VILEADPEIRLVAYIDASHSVHHDEKGHTGGHITLGKGGVVSKSTKQHITAKSSTEAELIALSDFASTVVHLRELLIELGYQQPPALIYQDNQSCMKLIERGRAASDRTRHIKNRYFWVKDYVQSGDLKIEYLETGKMVSDILTKPLVGAKFYKLRAALMNLGNSSKRGVLEMSPNTENNNGQF
jgi:hypothetical protein